jgi:hypothetical protein
LGYDPFFPSARRTIVVEITGVPGGLDGQMRLVDGNGMILGSRELHERLEHCDELIGSLALAISIALDPSAAPKVEPTAEPPKPVAAEPSETQTPAPEPTPAAIPSALIAPSPAKPVQQAAPKPAAIAAESEQSRFALRAGAFAALGAAPGPAFGFRVGEGSQWGWFRLVAELSDQLRASKTLDRVGVASASLLSATLAPCVAHQSLSGCALFGVGSLLVQASQVLDTHDQRLLNLTLGARFEFAPTLIGHLRLLTNIDLGTSLTPVGLHIHGQTVWDTPPVAAALGIGLEWRLQ